MKISKLLAGVCATAVMATMAISASAATTFTITDLQTPEWTNAFPKWTDGTTDMDDYVDAKSFTPDTPLEVTVNFEWTEDALDEGYINVKPASSANGWKPLGGTKSNCLGFLETNIPVINVDCVYAEVGYKMNDSDEIVDFCMQADGSIMSNNPDCKQITFTITAAGVNALIERANASSTAYDGFMVQTNGAQVTSIVASQDGVTLASATSGVKNPGIETTDDSGEPVDPDESTTDDESDTDESATDESATDESATDESATDESATDTDTPADSTADSAKKDDTSKGGKSDTTKTTTTTTTTSSSNDASPNTGAAAAAVAGIVLAGAAIVVAKKR